MASFCGSSGPVKDAGTGRERNAVSYFATDMVTPYCSQYLICHNLRIMQNHTFQQTKVVIHHFSVSLEKNKLLWQLFSFRETHILGLHLQRLYWYCISVLHFKFLLVMETVLNLLYVQALILGNYKSCIA